MALSTEIAIVVSGPYDPACTLAREMARQKLVVVVPVGGSVCGRRFSSVLTSDEAVKMRGDPHHARWFDEELALKILPR